MDERYLDRYRIASARLATWDYSVAALYFVTICTLERTHFFGQIWVGQMRLSDLGRIAETEWSKTAAIRADMNVALDAFCVMPNHVHMIVGIGPNAYNTPAIPDVPDGNNRLDANHGAADRNDGMDANHGRDAMHRVSTDAARDGRPPLARPTAARNGRPPSARPTAARNRAAPLARPTASPASVAGNRFGPQRKNLASIIRGYKSAVTTQARVLDLPFGWQPRYYDVIIHDAAALARIRRYIAHNPRRWRGDRFG